MEDFFCVNHPEIIAKRKCFLCKKPICKKCIKKKYHHIFCSEDCAKEYRKEYLLKNIKKKARMQIPLPLLILIILFSFGLIFFLFYKFKDEIFSFYVFTLKEKIKVSQSNIIKINPKKEGEFYKFKIKAPENGILLFSGSKENFFFLPVKKNENIFSSFKIPPKNYCAFLPTEFLNLSSSFNKSSVPLPVLGLTFDGGSIKNSSEEIIDFLKTENINPTFFLSGNFIKNYPEVVKKIADFNFEVGNHTYSHLHLTTYSINFKQNTKEDLNFEKLKNELEETNSIYKSITNKNMKNFWRAPYGEYNEEILKWAWKAGHFHIGWSWDSLDWMEEENPKFEKRFLKINELKERLKNNEKSLYGQILLFHLGNNNPEEIKEIVKIIKEKNIQILPVSALLATEVFYKINY